MAESRFWKWLLGSDQRREAQRHSDCTVVAYYWNGAISTARPLKNISFAGAYLLTDERWYIGTMFMLTLQPDLEIANSAAALTVLCKVVRHGQDGVGVRFMLTSREERHALRRFVRAAMGGQGAPKGTSGQAVVEYALMVPLLFLLLVNAFNFGSFIFCWLTVADAVRAAADYACTDSNTAGAPATPTTTKITTLVQNATTVLPNYSGTNPVITACTYNNGATTTFNSSAGCPAGVTTPPADPQPIASGSSTNYASVAVDVTYTFTPFFAGSSFLRFGLPALPTSIHRRMVVRWP